jgi:hypothetical protein
MVPKIGTIIFYLHGKRITSMLLFVFVQNYAVNLCLQIN